MPIRLSLFFVAIGLLCCGCDVVRTFVQTDIVEPHDYPVDKQVCVSQAKDREMARCVWQQFVNNHADCSFSIDYRDGFIDGFVDFVYYGKTVVAPSLPPQRYWREGYRTPEGQQAIQDWYAGFRSGASAAYAGGYREQEIVPSSYCAHQAGAMAEMGYAAAPAKSPAEGPVSRIAETAADPAGNLKK